MNVILTILVFLLIFSLIVVVHEFGHFIMARRAGIQVQEFGLGLPPRLIGWKSKKIKGMIWSLNWIPFGGFVRMLGEDARDPKALKNSASFVNKTLWQKFKVVVAGVVMNFLLAFVLLVIGFSVGIEPLMVTSEDFLQQLDAGKVVTQPGAVIDAVTEGSLAYSAGLRGGDVLVGLNGKMVNDVQVWQAFSNTPLSQSAVLSVFRRGKVHDIALNPPESGSETKPGIKLYNLVVLPKLMVQEVKILSTAYYVGLKPGDLILQINGKNVYNAEDYYRLLADSGKSVSYRVFRDNREKTLIVPLQRDSRVVISEVLSDSLAEKAGFQAGDVLLEINGQDIVTPIDTRNVVIQRSTPTVTYKIERQGKIEMITVEIPDNGYIGVLLSLVTPYRNSHISFYSKGLVFSVLDVLDVKYPWYKAPFKVFGEMKRLSILTAEMFGQVLTKIVSNGTVPSGVAGPVGIAQMTYVFLQKGFAALLRFTALLSLSLAVINILPLPALDGGRLAFILLEGLRGKPINPLWESRIHAIGFILLIILILFVTYHDVLRVIGIGG